MTAASIDVRWRAVAVAGRVRPHLPALIPGLVVVGLMLVWEVRDGGYDPQTWYWGAIVMLALAGAVALWRRPARSLGRSARITLVSFGAYVGWCYASIAWAQSPGDALAGANQALLYLLVYAVMINLPWTAPSALAALVAYATGVGVTAIVLLFRLASGDRVAALVVVGRLAAPTGYFNSTAALFTIGALTAIALAARRELPGLLRGLLLALACGDLQLALIVQSRGWLFTLPLVAVAAIALVTDRLRVVAATLIPVAGTVAIVHRLLAVFGTAVSGPTALTQAAERAARPALLICAGALVLGTLLAWADVLRRGRSLGRRPQRALGVLLAVVAVAGVGVTASYVSHGHPIRFVVREWNGFSHEQTTNSSVSHFLDVGSGRYDFWRSSLDAFRANPIGGLGEGNFYFWYLRHRRTSEEPTSPHSLELSLLSETGIVGFLLFLGFFIGALRLAVRARRSPGGPAAAAAASIAILPAAVWLIHGSVDWFWEIPALSGPALGFLGVAGALGVAQAPALLPSSTRDDPRAPIPPLRISSTPAANARWMTLRRRAAAAAGALALVAAVIVLGAPYLAVREQSLGSSAVAAGNSQAALADFRRASDLNPLWSLPGRLAGVVALEIGEPTAARRWFEQSIQREPGGWFAWLGAGLSASAQGQTAQARRYLQTAYTIDSTQPVIQQALAKVGSAHPLTISEALRLLVVQ
ncbi:MAG: O-antigen ligase family protein [Solirubrobacteraceae bacterium]